MAVLNVILTACYNGNGTPRNTRRSFVQGLRSYIHHYDYTLPENSFLYTVPREAYAMAATAVSLFVASWKHTDTCLLQLRFRLIQIANGGVQLRNGFHHADFQWYYDRVGTSMRGTFGQDQDLARQREERIRATIRA
jgi:hypothetical protein